MKVKKWLVVLIVAIMSLALFKNVVYADSVTVNLRASNTSYEAGSTVIVTVSLSNIDSTAGIYGLEGVIDYDTQVFEPLGSTTSGTTESITAVGDWGNVGYSDSSKYFSILTATPAKNSQSIMQIAFKIKENAVLGNTFIMLNNLKASNGDTDISTSPATLSLNIKEASGSVVIPTVQPTTQPTTAPTTQPTTAPTVKPTTQPTTVPIVINTPTPDLVKPTVPATVSGGKLPQTGINDHPVLILLGIALVTTGASFIAYRKYRSF